MTDVEQLVEGIEQVARFYEKRFGNRSPFHLSACGGCGCPCFKQPCSLCGYYPMGFDRGTWNPKVATRELFCSMVERSGPGGSDGTIATWHALSNLQKYESRDELVQAAAMIDVPAASEYWDAVCVEGMSLSRPDGEYDFYRVWNAVGDIGEIANGRMFQPQSRQAPKVNALVQDWVDAVHSGDRAEIEDVLGRLKKMTGELLYEYPRNGNLFTALEIIGRKIEELQDEPSMRMGA